MAKISGVHTDRVQLSEVVPLDTPFALNIYITSLCNFKCNYCFYTLDPHTKLEKYGPSMNMSFEDFKRIIDSAAKFPRKIKTILFTGFGEPLLHPDLPHMVKYAYSKGVAEKIELITNGSLLTHELSDALINSGLNYLRVSIQGVSAAHYSNISNVNIDFDTFVEQLHYFYKKKQGHNCQVYCKTVDAALQPGEDRVFYNIFSSCSDVINIEKVVVFDEDVKYKGIDNIGIEKNKNGLSVTRVEICPIPFYTIDIFPDGLISTCHMRGHCNLGTINNIGIYDAWMSERCRAFWKKLLLLDAHLKCSNCHFKEGLIKSGDCLDSSRFRILSRINNL